MATGIQVAMDCADPARMARFWAAALGYKLEDPPEGSASWDEWQAALGIPEEQWNDGSSVVDPEGTGPRLFFQQVPEPKTVKNRVHLDLDIGGGRGTPLEERRRRIDAEAERLIGAGATRLRTDDSYGGYFITIADPEGNEFDLH
jgi:catechol 2,3-dioxygenase-like lactoylglutathione lyase family enzyme